MRRTLLTLGLGLVVAFAFMAVVRAEEEDKDVTLKGKITCPKCELKKEKKCWTVIVVKKNDKEEIYRFDEKAHRKYHRDICEEGKKGTVKGRVKEKDKKKIITVKELKYDE